MGLFGKKDKGDDAVLTTKKDAISMIGKYLKDVEVEYEYNEEHSTFVMGTMGDDLPILTTLTVSDRVISFRCPLQLKAAPENYDKVVNALNDINFNLLMGAFYLDKNAGFILYEYGFPYNNSKLSEGFFLAILKMVIDTVDDHDGDLKGLAESVPRSEAKSTYESMYQ